MHSVRGRLRWTSWQFRCARFLLSWKQRPAPSPFLDYQTKTTLFLPFDGDWHVAWGGRSFRRNRHSVASDQRFAYDFLQLEHGWSFRDHGERNEDFICFGQPTYAPASAAVVSACDGVPDNIPGEMSGKNPLGNYVVLDHGNGEFSFLAHFQMGTLIVRPHTKVEAGDLLGKCGNSGNSSEPHLHFHLQNTPEPFVGMGLPAFFCDYRVNGTRVPRGEPAGGQMISK